VSWYQTDVNLRLPKHQDTSLGLTITDDPARAYRAEIYVNGWDMGNYVNYVGPQRSFPIPNGVLNLHCKNTIAIAVWNLDGSTGGLGTVALTNYGSYASSLTVAPNTGSEYDRALYAMPASAMSAVSLQVPAVVSPGQQFTATATVSVPTDKPAVKNVTAALNVPTGWTVSAMSSPSSIATIGGGSSASFSWSVTAPTPSMPKVNALTVTAHLVQTGTARSTSDERIVGSIPPLPPSGANQVSDLPFLSSVNGWGPVERDQSVGGSQANDGKPITINGTVYAKGLGTNSPSDVQVYLGGRCTRFTATVGVDDEVGKAGTVTFSVILDGKVLTSTSVLAGGSPSVTMDVSVASGQVLELVVGDGGDGNANDHGDWANPVVTCT
jgi:hypothetical protein